MGQEKSYAGIKKTVRNDPRFNKLVERMNFPKNDSK